MEYITYKFKKRAKELHPDIGGDEDEFKKLNDAYKQIQEEGEQSEIRCTDDS